MLDLVTRHKKHIKSFQVLLYEQEGDLFRFKAKLQLKDDSKIFIKEYVFETMLENMPTIGQILPEN
jgi:hypothetical protein